MVNVLLVEDNDGDAKLLERKFRLAETEFEVKRVEWLSSALTVAQSVPIDVALLDLSLPDSQGLDTVISFVRAAPSVPVVVMTGYDDMKTAMQAVRMGAKDYLIKGQLHDRHLERTVLIAVERHRIESVERRLLHTSLGQVIGAAENDGPTVAMLRGHIEKLAGTLEALLQYVRKNAPTKVEDVKAIVDGQDIPVVLREIRAILDLDQTTRTTLLPLRKKQSLTDLAAAEVAGVIQERLPADAGTPSTFPSAQQAVLEIIEGRVEDDD